MNAASKSKVLGWERLDADSTGFKDNALNYTVSL